MKRIFDLTCAFFGLIILSPLLIFVSIIIKVTSRGAIFYKQERTGRNAEIFTIIKFRSMIENHGDDNTVKPFFGILWQNKHTVVFLLSLTFILSFLPFLFK